MAYRLVKDDISREDVIQAISSLLDLARANMLVGVGFVGMLRNSRYFVNVAGQCYKNPTLTRGALATLDDELASIIRSRDPGETR